MKTTKRKTSRRVAKASKCREPQRGRSRRRFITRGAALAQARQHVLDRMFKGATVRDGEEARIKAYGVRHKDTWVVYKKLNHQADRFVLKSSEVVVICKRTGLVLYDGLAGEEG